MSRLLCSVVVVVAGIAVIAAPARAAPDEDFVVGTGEILVGPTGFPPSLLSVVIDAHSDATGGNPSGTFNILIAGDGSLFSGPVTCLAVSGNLADIGIEDARAGHLVFEVVDNSATGSPDTITFFFAAAGTCPLGVGGPGLPLVSGDFVVHDAVPLTSKDQCKDGGWRNFTDDEGHPFENQGECIAFVQHV
jgi:hypothetical protein